MKRFKGLIYPITILIIAALLVGAIVYSRHKHPKSKEKFDNKNGYNVDDYIELGKYKGLEGTQEKVYITDEDVDSEIENELSEEVEVTEALKKGDFVNLNLTVKIDGQEVAELGESDYDFCIGDEDYCSELDSSLLGKKKGDAYTFKVADAANITSSNYEGDEYNGKEAEVYATINSAYNYIEHELTDEYVKEKFDANSVDEYKKSVKEKLEKDSEKDNAYAMKEELFNKVVEDSKMKSYPEDLYDEVSEDAYSSLQEEASQWDMELEDFLKQFYDMKEDQKLDDFLKKYYEEQIKNELVLKAICKAENLEVTDDVYKKYIDEYVADYEYDSVESFEKDYTKDEIKESMVYDLVYDFLAENATVKMVEPSTEEDEELDDEYYEEDEEDTDEPVGLVPEEGDTEEISSEEGESESK